jgi:hypothetical protein
MSKAITANIDFLVDPENMAARGGANVTYSLGQLVTLVVSQKRSTQAVQLPCRVLKIIKGAYTLLSFYGRLKGLTKDFYSKPFLPTKVSVYQ